MAGLSEVQRDLAQASHEGAFSSGPVGGVAGHQLPARSGLER